VELTISASPFELAGLRRAARDALDEVPTQVADEMLLALDEAATNAILHGSDGGDPIQVAVRGLCCCLVDEVRLERVEGGTRVTLRRRVRPPSAVTGVERHPWAARAVS
jgi:hypothetical protein